VLSSLAQLTMPSVIMRMMAMSSEVCYGFATCYGSPVHCELLDSFKLFPSAIAFRLLDRNSVRLQIRISLLGFFAWMAASSIIMPPAGECLSVLTSPGIHISAGRWLLAGLKACLFTAFSAPHCISSSEDSRCSCLLYEMTLY
jgi:hypothetical protein